MPKKIKIENKIRDMRICDGMTQIDLAMMCEVTRQTIISLEAGRYSPSLELAYKLSVSLGSTIEEVFTFSEWD